MPNGVVGAVDPRTGLRLPSRHLRARLQVAHKGASKIVKMLKIENGRFGHVFKGAP